MVAAAEKILNRKSGGLGSLIGATQATEAVEGENFLTGQALTGLDRWGMAFQGISAASGVAALGVDAAGQLDFSGLFGRTAAKSAAGVSSTLTNFSGKVGQATDGVLGGFIKADGTVDFVPFTRNGLIGNTAAQSAGAIPTDAAGGFSIRASVKSTPCFYGPLAEFVVRGRMT